MVFYRKYRPQIIDDLDSESVRQTLTSVLSKEVPHAFLFTGPKGLGKTSAARIVAKIVNCTTPEKKRKNGFEPCGTCDTCKSITEGTNMDILEIDAASNRGIDEIRDLKEKIKLSPMNAKKKVYIIDEVHMLTTEAFNALLKTLEEPPDHAMFILCTTEPQKVPPTIISRCMHINFNLATEEEIVRSLKRIVTGEKLKFDDSALLEIAKLSDGAFRDSAKILEEVTLLSKEQKITKETIKNIYSSTDVSLHVSTFLKSLEMQDTKSSLEIIKTMTEQGIDIKFFITQTLNELHKMLLEKMGVEKNTNTKSKVDFEIQELRVLIEILSNAYQEMKYAVLPQLPLELAVIEFTDMMVSSEDGMIDSPIRQVVTSSDSKSISDLRKQVGNIKKIKAMYGPAKQDSSSGKTSKEEKDLVNNKVGVSLLHTAASGKVTNEWLDNLWRSIISEMKEYNHTIAGVLRGCRIGEYDKKKLVIETSYKFHKERLDDVKTRTELARIAKMLTGNTIEIEVQLKK